MTKDVPYIAHMIIIQDTLSVNNYKRRIPDDKSYYNPKYDSSSEYCQNTSSWD